MHQVGNDVSVVEAVAKLLARDVSADYTARPPPPSRDETEKHLTCWKDAALRLRRPIRPACQCDLSLRRLYSATLRGSTRSGVRYAQTRASPHLPPQI